MEEYYELKILLYVIFQEDLFNHTVIIIGEYGKIPEIGESPRAANEIFNSYVDLCTTSIHLYRYSRLLRNAD